PRAIAMLARAASGLTRRINILADKSLLCAFTENSHAITDRQVRAAIADSEFARTRTSGRPALYVGAALAAGLLAGAAVQWWISAPAPQVPRPAPIAAPDAAPAAPAPLAVLPEAPVQPQAAPE